MRECIHLCICGKETDRETKQENRKERKGAGIWLRDGI